ncbi:MAG TPA: hypothetical protein VFT65_07015, partial [Candidatus Angelobacter sp.]|nr:hypothetical protein [Candidatus Angelobacter sp.]
LEKRANKIECAKGYHLFRPSLFHIQQTLGAAGRLAFFFPPVGSCQYLFCSQKPKNGPVTPVTEPLKNPH